MLICIMSAQGVDERMINVDSSSFSSILVDKMEYNLKTTCDYNYSFQLT